MMELSDDAFRHLISLIENMHISIYKYSVYKSDFLEAIKDDINSDIGIKCTMKSINIYKIFDIHDLEQIDKFLFPNICIDKKASFYLIDKYLYKKTEDGLKRFWTDYC